MAKNVVVVGSQWGDEGKGKIVDWLAEGAAGVVRFQGGHNAGHTLVVGKTTYALNLVPSGIVHPGVSCFIGNGVVLNAGHLLEEIEKLEAGGIAVQGRIFVSPGCPLILPCHSALDHAREAKRSPDAKIGTTGKGIGPAYEDKVARRAIRVADLYSPNLQARLHDLLDLHNFSLSRSYGAAPIDEAKTLQLLKGWAEKLRPMAADVSARLCAIRAAGGNLLFEGAQGS
ncbi:MAG: adenylosuccinate synthetase, partial [Zoogloeaceae bacterium]|nr:adenylosuccinate synthetase [Zoogloeaceae bacterium]